MYISIFKPIFDKAIAIIALIFLSPILLIIFFILKTSIKGSIFFIHERPGFKEKPFKVIKFKTMNEKKDVNGELLPNMHRITKIGSILRKTSLDEIPQLLNVIKGDISLVGPRPLEMRYLPYYTKKQKVRHYVRPGITGWAQINGRNAISWEEKFEYDIWYVNNISFILDLKILFVTFIKVFKSEGINANSSNTIVPLDIYLTSKQDDQKNKHAI